MNVTYFEKERIFKLDTPNTSYLLGIVDEENFIGHIYYGKRLQGHDIAYRMRTQEAPFVQARITESAAPSMTASHLNILQQDWEITEKAACLFVPWVAIRDVTCPMFPIEFWRANHSWKDFLLPLQTKKQLQHWNLLA